MINSVFMKKKSEDEKYDLKSFEEKEKKKEN